MLTFLNKNFNSSVKLISIHIPKTAGTSFGKLLEKSEKKNMLRVYGEMGNSKQFWDAQQMKIRKHYKIIHGHFPASKQLLISFPNAKIVTWVRNPVDRIISYYCFWKKYPRHGNPNHDYFLDNNLSIIEFCKLPYIQNELSKYINGISLDEFYFIGLTEQFEEDIKILFEKLKYRYKHIPHENQNPVKKDFNIERPELEKILKDDMELYNDIIKIRKLL